jgi:hypothetical protein
MSRFTPALLVLGLAACSDTTTPGEEDKHDHDHDHGVTTSVELSFLPVSGGETATFAWSDPEGDGSPVIDTIELDAGVDYTMTVALWNELEDPAEDVTGEIREDAEAHQFFVFGDAVEGPATGENSAALVVHSYADQDANGLPIGLSNDLSAVAAGSGTLSLALRHMPPESGSDVKTAEAAEIVATDGFGALGGDTDVLVDFPIEVQ